MLTNVAKKFKSADEQVLRVVTATSGDIFAASYSLAIWGVM